MSFLSVQIYHGPCKTFYSERHKPQLVTGLRDRLRKLGFRVDLVPVRFINYCMLQMCGYQVFCCNIRYLKFNTSFERDLVCQRAVEAVINAAVKFRNARSTLWFWTLMDHQLFRRTPHAPKDYWPVDVNTMKYGSSLECINCCNIRVTLVDDDDEEDQDKKEVAVKE